LDDTVFELFLERICTSRGEARFGFKDGNLIVKFHGIPPAAGEGCPPWPGLGWDILASE
jgi:hypothetical protein